MGKLKELFDAARGEYLEFERVENAPSRRADLAAFILLDRLLPENDRNLISCSEHDEFFLSIDCDELEKIATPELIRDLTRCGIRYDESSHSLCMFA